MLHIVYLLLSLFLRIPKVHFMLTILFFFYTTAQTPSYLSALHSTRHLSHHSCFFCLSKTDKILCTRVAHLFFPVPCHTFSFPSAPPQGSLYMLILATLMPGEQNRVKIAVSRSTPKDKQSPRLPQIGWIKKRVRRESVMLRGSWGERPTAGQQWQGSKAHLSSCVGLQ